MGEEALKLLLQWPSVILLTFILGCGYVGLCLIESLKKKNHLFKMPVFDKLVRSILLGFLGFGILLDTLKVDITDQQAIIDQISKYGFPLFLNNLLLVILISFTIYVYFYLLPNSKLLNKKRKKSKSKKGKIYKIKKKIRKYLCKKFCKKKKSGRKKPKRKRRK